MKRTGEKSRAWTAGRNLLLSALAAGFLAGCSDGATGPGGPGAPVSLSIALKAGGAQPSASLFGQATTDGFGNTLDITSAEIVLREIEFKRVSTANCDVPGADDDCEEFEADPQVVSLPVGGANPVEKVVTAQVPEGTYREVEFDVHKLDDTDPRDQAILAMRPELSQISIVVKGTFNGMDFTYTSDLNEKQEIEFAPGNELVVTADPATGTSTANVTLTIDLDSWFMDPASGQLIDPATALKGGPNENLVRDNIRNSIEGYRDDDGDGIAHSEDGDEDAI